MFESHHPCGSSQPSIIPVPGDATGIHTVHIHAGRHSYIKNKINNSLRKKKIKKSFLTFTQDEVTTIITIPKKDTTPLSAKPSILSMKPPEGLAMSVEYDPLYIFVSTGWQMPVFRIALSQQLCGSRSMSWKYVFLLLLFVVVVVLVF
jgi:hypothetical protein